MNRSVQGRARSLAQCCSSGDRESTKRRKRSLRHREPVEKLTSVFNVGLIDVRLRRTGSLGRGGDESCQECDRAGHNASAV
eukprot:2924493-Amphidinium_carterae.1